MPVAQVFREKTVAFVPQDIEGDSSPAQGDSGLSDSFCDSLSLEEGGDVGATRSVEIATLITSPRNEMGMGHSAPA